MSYRLLSKVLEGPLLQLLGQRTGVTPMLYVHPSFGSPSLLTFLFLTSLGWQYHAWRYRLPTLRDPRLLHLRHRVPRPLRPEETYAHRGVNDESTAHTLRGFLTGMMKVMLAALTLSTLCLFVR